MLEIIFLSLLALLWISFAMVQDLKKREIANWLNFSLIIFVLGFRFFYSLFNLENFSFFYQGLVGLAIFFTLGNVLYYSRFFAGGDAKLMIALGAVLPFSESFSANLKTFAGFLLIFLFVGAIYSLTMSLVISLKNFKKFRLEFKKQFKTHRKIINLTILTALIIGLFGLLLDTLFFYLALLIFIFPYIYLYAKSVDEACMIKKVPVKNLTEGDWLYKDVKIGNRVIRANWGGLNKNEIKMLRKKLKNIEIRQGIPFSPVFLVSFLILVLWNSFW